MALNHALSPVAVDFDCHLDDGRRQFKQTGWPLPRLPAPLLLELPTRSPRRLHGQLKSKRAAKRAAG